MRDGQVACPHCGHGFSRTLLTQKTRRRRQCVKCLKRFTTYEKYADHMFGYVAAVSSATEEEHMSV